VIVISGPFYPLRCQTRAEKLPRQVPWQDETNFGHWLGGGCISVDCALHSSCYGFYDDDVWTAVFLS
jgi:hypothetical protein